MITAEIDNTTITDKRQIKDIDESWAVKLMNECKQEMSISASTVNISKSSQRKTKEIKKNSGYSETTLSAIEIQIKNWKRK